MDDNKLSRRGFIRLAGIAALSSAAAACSRGEPEPAPSGTLTPLPSATLPPEPTLAPSPTPTQVVESVIAFSGEDADAWAWQKTVAGSLTNPESCKAVLVAVNGVEVSAQQEGQRFTADVPIQEGDNRLVAVCQRKDGSEEKSTMQNYTGRLKHRPTAMIQASLQDGRILLSGAESLPAEDHGAPIIERIWTWLWRRENTASPVLVQSVPGLKEREFDEEISAESISLAVPQGDGEYYFGLRVVDKEGYEDRAATYFVVEDGRARLPKIETENPAWADNAVVYGVIPRNFGNKGFTAISEKLDYLQELGVNALWLAPINVSPAGDYGYAVKDYFELNPNNGTKEDFHRMVQEAHARGIRVLMDFVPNHSSVEHPYFVDTLDHGKDSPYWSFYDRDANGIPTHYFDWEHLPNLNYDNPEVERWMLEAFSYWVREFDVDGFRVDVAWGVKQRKPEFWPRWRRELKRIKPDLLLLAEASARDPYYFDNGYDAAYDWTDQLGKWAWELVFDAKSLIIYNLDKALTNNNKGFHPDALIFRFLNNNDTGTRFITTHGLERTMVSTAMLLTLPGVPCIYTGDEVGEAFRPYYDPQPLTWKENYPGLLDYHKKLIALRKEVPSLHSRLWLVANLEPHTKVYGYLRYLEGNEQPVLVLLNFYEDEAEVNVHLPEEFQAKFRGSLDDLLNGGRFSGLGSSGLKVKMPGYGVRILAPQQRG